MQPTGSFLILLWLLVPVYPFIYGKLEPPDPHVVVGGTLTLTCTLTKYSGRANASNIHFAVPGNEILPATHVLNATSAQLIRTNMQLNMSAYYRCNINESSFGGVDNQWVASQKVNVGYPPEKPKNITCVSENWESMTCSWCNGRDPNINTKWKLTWSILDNQSLDCPKYKERNCSCFFEAPNFTKPTKYRFLLQGVNAYGKVMLNDSVTTNEEIVKPDEVSSMSIAAQSNVSIQANWSYPDRLGPSYFPLVFKVTYSSEWTNVTKSVLVGKKQTFLLQGLTPYTHYTVSVASRPEMGMYWSEKKTGLVQTLQGTPKYAPHVTAGSFQKESEDVILFWQSVERKDRHGEITRHVIKFGNSESVHPVESMHFLKLPYKRNKAIDADINICTEIGCAATPSTIHIPAVGPALPEAEDVTAELKGNTTTITISHQNPPADRYTLYMCQGIRSKPGCRSEIEWFHVDGTERTWSISRPGTTLEQYKFSLSVEKRRAGGRWESSGMMSWLCVVHFDGKPLKGPPVTQTTPGERSVLVKWRPLDCDDSRGKVHHYIIEYQAHFSNGTKGPSQSVETGSTEYHLINLLPNTEYEVKVAAHTRHPGPFGNSRMISTKESAPGTAPTIVTISNVTASTAKVAWIPSSEPNGVIVRYEIHVEMGDVQYRARRFVRRLLTLHGYVDYANGTQTDKVLAALEGDTSYSISIQACTKAGCSPRSRPVGLTTLIGAPGAIHADAIIMDGDSPEDEMRMTWSPPYQPNGPISEYLLRFVWDYGNGPHSETARVPRNQLSYEQKFACNGTVVKVNYTVTAINVDKKGVQHLGAPSETRFYNICSMPPPVVGIILGSVFGSAFLCVLVYALIWSYKRFQRASAERFKFEAVKKPPPLKILSNRRDKDEEYPNSVNIDIPLPHTPDESSSLIKFDKEMNGDAMRDKDSDCEQQDEVTTGKSDVQRRSPVQRSVSEDSGTGTSLASEQASRSPLSSASDEDEARLRNPSGSQGSRRSLLPEIPEDDHEAQHTSPNKKHPQTVPLDGQNSDGYYSKFALKESPLVQLQGLHKHPPNPQELTVAFVQGHARGPQHQQGSMDYYSKVAKNEPANCASPTDYVQNTSGSEPIGEYSKFSEDKKTSVPNVSVITNGYVDDPSRAQERLSGGSPTLNGSMEDYSKVSKSPTAGQYVQSPGDSQGYVGNTPLANGRNSPNHLAENANINTAQPHGFQDGGYITAPPVTGTTGGYVAAPQTDGAGGYVAAPQTGGAGGYVAAPQTGGAGGYVEAPQNGGAGGYVAAPQAGGYVAAPQNVGVNGYVAAPQNVGVNGYVAAPQNGGAGGYVEAPQTGGYVAAPQTSGYVAAPQTSGYVAAPPQTGGYVAAPQTGGLSNDVGSPSITNESENLIDLPDKEENVQESPACISSDKTGYVDAPLENACMELADVGQSEVNPSSDLPNGYVAAPIPAPPAQSAVEEGSTVMAPPVPQNNGYVTLPTTQSPTNQETLSDSPNGNTPTSSASSASTAAGNGPSPLEIDAKECNETDAYVKQPSRDSGYIQSPPPGLQGSPNFPIKAAYTAGSNSKDNGYDSPPDSPGLKMAPPPLKANGYVQHIPVASEC